MRRWHYECSGTLDQRPGKSGRAGKDEKQKGLGIRNTGAYMRKMAMDGYCVNLDLSDVAQVSTLLRRCSNNLNQYAKRANESGSIYAEDIRDLQKRLDELWEMQKLILKRLSGIR